jgi:hypothetical protein
MNDKKWWNDFDKFVDTPVGLALTCLAFPFVFVGGVAWTLFLLVVVIRVVGAIFMGHW